MCLKCQSFMKLFILLKHTFDKFTDIFLTLRYNWNHRASLRSVNDSTVHRVWLVSGVNDMYCGVLLSGVNETMESDSAVSMTCTGESYSAVSTKPRSLAQRCQWHCGVLLSCVNEIMESDSAVSMTLRSFLHAKSKPSAKILPCVRIMKK